MWYIIIRKYIFYLLEILVYISDHEHHLIMNAKFHSSTMNIAYTMSPVDMLATPQKLYGWQHSCLILSIFSYDFSVSHWPADLGCQLMKCIKV